jgi:hypothetical protein
MKHASNNKGFFNRLRKMADKFHQPMPQDYLNGVTEAISNNSLSMRDLRRNLEDVNVFRKVRLAKALKTRMNDDDAVVYLIRNGKSWAEERTPWNKKQTILANRALKVVYDSIVDSLRPNVGGLTFYVPESVHYALPSTEKQFVGNIPNGTSFEIAKDSIFGVHWFNTDCRVDLDLSLLSVSGKFGWDGSYRSRNRDILYSGDMTDASGPRGASEFFRLQNNHVDSPFLVSLNHYNRNMYSDEVPFTIIIGKASSKAKSHIVDLNNVDITIKSSLCTKNNILGVVHNNMFTVFQSSVGGARTASNNKVSELTRNYLANSACNSSIKLVDAFKDAGGNVVHEVPDDVDYVDLSPESINKTTILELLQ